MTDELLTSADVAAVLGCHLNYVTQRTRPGGARHERWTRRWKSWKSPREIVPKPLDNVGASAQDTYMNTTTATVPVIISQPAYGKGGRTRIGTRRLGHLATDVTDGRTLCGIRMDAPDLENVRVMPFERSVECFACKQNAARA